MATNNREFGDEDLDVAARLADPQLGRATAVAPRVARRPKVALAVSKALGIALAALLVLPIAQATQPAEAGKKFKTITKTISSNGQIAIPNAGSSGPANPYPATIKVDAFKKFKKAKITDVNLTLHGFNHDRSENVDVMLALGNTNAFVMGDAGNATDISNATITLDDQSGNALPDGVALTAGTYHPSNIAGADSFDAPAPALSGNETLAAFNGLNPDGEWRLFIDDDFNADTGSISGGWELEITAKVKEKKDKHGNNGKKGKRK